MHKVHLCFDKLAEQTMKKRLGRGLDAFISQTVKNEEPVLKHPHSEPDVTSHTQEDLRKLPIDSLQPGRYQPRKIMEDDALEELANSIKAQGVIQPIVVRPISDKKFEIIAGERRWRASQLAKLTEVPVVVKQVPDEAAIAMALIENIQREDLNAIEEASALQRLMHEFDLTHQQVADAVGKSRTTVTNLLRLLQLSDACKTLLERGDIEMGHARAMLGLKLEQQTSIARQVVAKGLTVRETEKLVRQLQMPTKTSSKQSADPHIVQLEQEVAETLGASVALQHSPKGKGKLVISYNSLEELQGILQHIGIKELS